ncbi:hypothetical protein BV20DRAFT_1125692 [Pilatotrama ljubarskyi]|nr:hypothetical protein BV20DRAFT_1125692 [Pilatotrama ljubarskyi]
MSRMLCADSQGRQQHSEKVRVPHITPPSSRRASTVATMSASPSNSTAAPVNPLSLLPKVPSLDDTFGAFLIATFLGLIMYGLTLHQSYRYCRLFPKDAMFLRIIVILTVVLETLHIVLCMHVCYYYLVTKYFNPAALLDGVWSIRILPISTVLVILVSEGFFTRRVYLIGRHYRAIVVVVPILMLAILGFAIAASVDAFLRPTFADFEKVTWLTSAGFGIAVVVDFVLTGALIMTLQKSRTGFQRTDSLIDLLIIYAINTGLLTGIFSVLSFIFAITSPSKLIYSAFNIIAAKSYANSLLAVLNSRKGLMDRVQGDCFGSDTLAVSAAKRSGDSGSGGAMQLTAVQTWNKSQQQNAGHTGSAGTMLDIRIGVERQTRSDVESVETTDKDLEQK